MTPLAIGTLLAVAAMVWVIAPIFSHSAFEKPRDAAAGTHASSPAKSADDAAEEAIRKWRQPEK